MSRTQSWLFLASSSTRRVPLLAGLSRLSSSTKALTRARTEASTSSTTTTTTIRSTASLLAEASRVSPSTYYYYGDAAVSVMSVLILVFMVLSVLGNAMVVLTVVRHRGMRTRTNMFIVNLAVADILVAVLDMPVSLATLLRGDWTLGYGFCQFNGFTMALLLMCSIHTLMYMSVHKYVSITRPFSRAMTKRRVGFLIAAAWLWPFFCALTPFLGLTKIVYKIGASQCGPAYPHSMKMYAHSALITVTNYFVPLIVMGFCYFNIFRAIGEHMTRVKATSNISLHNSVTQQKRINVTLVLVLLCFLFCWTPYMIYTFVVNSRTSKTKVPYILNPVAYWFGYLNSACNPIIYAFRSPSFRHGYKELLFGSGVTVVSCEGEAPFLWLPSDAALWVNEAPAG
ncbi:dopamine D2-like receptor [Ixodes scapularis]|uniref:dopamine D2-like receptor n=1 Tax=Ixodes scapularis TaxID=6945 RepID=UPI001A9D3310|nr:dopamine D2-like receptor [Ixodes scapularis]